MPATGNLRGLADKLERQLPQRADEGQRPLLALANEEWALVIAALRDSTDPSQDRGAKMREQKPVLRELAPEEREARARALADAERRRREDDLRKRGLGGAL
ncbi:hypothetical protein MMMDOFMJ_1708 [Methylobacterium gnaphalii]|uniref:Uncharacterized protein n=1 Tax=Methylobacterium gnaphalii TaxID=1010610 RepID=A0A512JP19_9HYPH|nr:hypothetical protein [Methylobacterium gnaphalii]GEP11701.1 hypothetical protein MGN01_35460 [Methylobacterium gnaphalii]GJD68784.1 hypothetical protein MMMDOFMJ_1708 [Methylobacterium gnaphalii]GLS50198.1 hypothetical protein GCM10007885_30500 [Methylobacterium gnaphalii]